jgi:hypothetical protein
MVTFFRMVEPTQVRLVPPIEASVSTEARRNRRVLLPLLAILLVVFVIELLIR